MIESYDAIYDITQIALDLNLSEEDIDKLIQDFLDTQKHTVLNHKSIKSSIMNSINKEIHRYDVSKEIE